MNTLNKNQQLIANVNKIAFTYNINNNANTWTKPNQITHEYSTTVVDEFQWNKIKINSKSIVSASLNGKETGNLNYNKHLKVVFNLMTFFGEIKCASKLSF